MFQKIEALSSLANPSAERGLSQGDYPPAVVKIIGELDVSVAHAVGSMLEALSASCEIDMSDVPYIDASIITEFVRMAKRVAPDPITLVGVRPQIRRVIDLCKLDRVFAFRDTPSSTAPRTVWQSPIT